MERITKLLSKITLSRSIKSKINSNATVSNYDDKYNASKQSEPILETMPNDISSLCISPRVIKSKCQSEKERQSSPYGKVQQGPWHESRKPAMPIEKMDQFVNCMNDRDKNALIQAINGFKVGSCRYNYITAHDNKLLRLNRRLIYLKMDRNIKKFSKILRKFQHLPLSPIESDTSDEENSYSDNEFM
ncbi:hypothetical protein HZS_4677 [Henneguya salminicola]|nr:hypothetical protein HZS_4677 [Henneguya salminicola]